MPIKKKKRTKGIHLKSQKNQQNIVTHKSSCLHANMRQKYAGVCVLVCAVPNLMGCGCSWGSWGITVSKTRVQTAYRWNSTAKAGTGRTTYVSPPRNTKGHLKYYIYLFWLFYSFSILMQGMIQTRKFKETTQGRTHNWSYCQSILNILIVFTSFWKSSTEVAQGEGRK